MRRWHADGMGVHKKPLGERLLATKHSSLALGVPQSMPGTVYVLAITGGMAMRPGEGRALVFGRNREDVHVCVGENDQQVSRRHGLLMHRRGQWEVTNIGRRPLRFPDSRLLYKDDEPIPLVSGYTPLFIRGSARREHLLELYVAGDDEKRPGCHPADPTLPPKVWQLTRAERLLMVVLAQRYLLHEPYPQPLGRAQAARHLGDLQPDAGWTYRMVEHAVEGIRARLSRDGVPGLTREEVGEPVGNALNHNLIRVLMESTTLVPPDLRLLDYPE